MTTVADYLTATQSAIAGLAHQPLHEVAALVADCVQSGGMVHVFGSGHSQLVAMEVCSRAGGLAALNPLVDPGLSPALPDRAGATERLPGYAAVSLGQWDLRPGELLLIVSNSGINPVPVEIAQAARQRGLTTVAITSRLHSLKATPRTQDGLRLLDCVDWVIDTAVPYGDTTLEVQRWRTGPVSSIIAIAAIHAIVAAAVELLLTRGVEPPLITSQNTLDGDGRNDLVRAAYLSRLVLR